MINLSTGGGGELETAGDGSTGIVTVLGGLLAFGALAGGVVGVLFVRARD